MENKIDIRTKRTYKLLSEALFELLSEQSFENIKVTDICEKAMVHRTTFYKYFEDKYQLLEYVVKELTQEFNNQVVENHSSINNIQEYYNKVARIFLNHISKNQKFYLSILANNSNNIAMDLTYDLIVKDIKSKLEEEVKNGIEHKIPIDIIAEFYVGAVFKTCIYWLRNQKVCTSEELIKYIDMMINNLHE